MNLELIEPHDPKIKKSKSKQRSVNDLAEWYPIIEKIVLTPETKIIDVRDIELLSVLDGQNKTELQIATERVNNAIMQIGLPCFLRTGLTSAKHDWIDTCYLNSMDDVSQHIVNLIEFSAICDVFGPSIDIDTLVVRSLLNTNALFTAFNDMLITCEMRVFVRNEQVTYIQPYWPKESFYDHVENSEWSNRISKLQYIDLNSLDHIKKGSILINKQIPGYWSID